MNTQEKKKTNFGSTLNLHVQLMLKDYEIIKPTLWRNLLLLALVMIAMATMSKINVYFVYYFSVFLMLGSLYVLFSAEEKYHTLTWIRSFPVTNKMIVTSRFATYSLGNLSITLLALVAMWIMHGQGMLSHYSFSHVVMHFGIMTLGLTAITAVSLPLFYRNGYTKGSNQLRMFFLTLVLLPFAAGLAISKVNGDSGLKEVAGQWIDALKTLAPWQWGLITASLALVLLAGAYPLSLKFFNQYSVLRD